MESVALEQKPRRIFLSYSHDSPAHRDRVLDLSERLRDDGVDARIDQYVEHEGHNWPDWCEEQIRDADLVLTIATAEYRKAVEGRAAPGERKGVCWEADQIKQEIYDAGSRKDKFVPVLLDGASPEDIPQRLRSVSFFALNTPEGYENLFRRITGQPRVKMKQLGQLRSLPSLRPRSQQNPERYLNWLRGETGRVELDRLLDSPDQIPAPAIDSLYINLETRSGQIEKRAPDAPGRVPLEDILQNRLVVIEGAPGCGKTTFLRRIAWRLCRPDPQNDKLPLPAALRQPDSGFPLLVRIYRLDEHISATLSARESGDPATADDPRWIAHYLAHQGWGLDEHFFAAKLSEAGNVLLIDGLDEASSERRREEIVEVLHKAVRQYDCHFVVTTRPGAHQRKATLHDFTRAFIEELDAPGIDGFLWRWSLWLKRGEEAAAAAHHQTLVQAVRAGALNHLARNPLMLTALAVVHYKNRKLPEQRADLYEEIVQWLGAQAESRSRQHRYSREDFLDWLGQLAMRMQTGAKGQRLQVSLSKGAGLIAEKFRPEPPKSADEVALRFLECAHWSCGLVTLRSNDLVFWHRTFQEYLAARAISTLNDAKLWQNTRKLLYAEEGREVLPLLAGRLMVTGRDRLQELFGKALRDAASQQALAKRAHAYATVRRMLADLASTRFQLSETAAASLAGLGESVLEIFQRGKAKELGVETLVVAAEALGELNPNLRTPRDPEYWVSIPGGTFTMGAQKDDPSDVATWDPEADNDETVRRDLRIDGFRMGRHPVTVWEYGRFLDEARGEDGIEPDEWEEQSKYPGRPVTNVSWNQAVRYCAWFGCRLPREDEWEFAARGEEGRRYPWGPEPPDDSLAFFGGKLAHAAPVGLLPDGATPEGLQGLAGNVWEWTGSDYGQTTKVVRGGDSTTLRGRCGPRSAVGSVLSTGPSTLGFVASGNNFA